MLFATLFSLFAFFSSDIYASSAKRLPGEDYKVALARELGDSFADNTPVATARPYPEANSDEVVTWPSLNYLTTQFESIRNKRFLEDPERDEFPRRITWLYPDDGCWIRAALGNLVYSELKEDLPSKVFIFGNLKVKTENSSSGEVRWWYHVALSVKVGQDIYVLDPAISPQKPLLVTEWISRQVPALDKAKISFCHPHSYVPGSKCRGLVSNPSPEALKDIRAFLSKERSRLLTLKRDPEEELGENPPWDFRF